MSSDERMADETAPVPATPTGPADKGVKRQIVECEELVDYCQQIEKLYRGRRDKKWETGDRIDDRREILRQIGVDQAILAEDQAILTKYGLYGVEQATLAKDTVRSELEDLVLRTYGADQTLLTRNQALLAKKADTVRSELEDLERAHNQHVRWMARWRANFEKVMSSIPEFPDSIKDLETQDADTQKLKALHETLQRSRLRGVDG